MRVLHVIPSVAESGGGPSKAIIGIERALTGLGVEVVTVTTDDEMHARPGEDGANSVLQGTRLYFSRQTRFYKASWPMAVWLRRHIPDFDVVHVHALFSFAPVVAARLARLHGVPYVIRPLGVLNHYGMSQRRAALKRWSVRWIEGPLLRDAAVVHFTSRQELNEAGALGIPMRGEVVPLGVEPLPEVSADAILSRHPELRGHRCLLYMSRIDPKKNLEALLDALPGVLAVHPDVRLLICGSGSPEYTTALRQRARDLSLQDHVIWAGHIEGELKAAALRIAELFVLPSWSENFGIAAVEALSAGLPSVLGQGVAVSEAVADAGAGVAIDPTSVCIASELLRMLGDPEWCARASVKARELARELYSVEAMGRGLFSMYSRLMATKGDAG